MGITIELNDSPSDSLKEAAKKHIDAGAGETLEEAFSRILGGKNISELEKGRILSVKDALEKGDITRESKAYKANGTLKRLGKAEVLRLYSIIEEREKERTLQQMKDDMPDNYWLVDNEGDIHSMEEALMSEEIIPIDVETTGTDIWSDYIVGYVLSSVTGDIHYYIPTRHETDEPQLDHDAVTTFLKRLLEKKDVLYIGHNIKFDLHMLMNEGINVKGTLWDTQEAMKLLNENESTYALKNLATKYLDIPSKTYGQLFGKKGFHEVDDLLLATAYAAKDGDVTYKLYEFQRKHLEGRFPSIYKYAVDVEMPLIHAVVEMERTGFVIDTEFAKEYGEELQAEIDEVRENIGEVLGEVNLNSPAQVKPALEQHIGRELPNTDAKKTLKPLSKEFTVVADILRYKELSKLYGTYVDKLPTFISEKTGRLMATFNQNGAKTGRFSSGGGSVNLQNQPSEARNLFVASEGKVILGGDFSQQEYRALTAFSKEPKLLENYRNGNDLYQTTASEIFEKPLEECGDGSIYRKQMKVILLAIAYGTAAGTLSMQLGKSRKEAQRILDDFKTKYPTLGEWIESNKTFVQRNGFVWMDGQARKRRLPDALDRNSDFWYTAVNTQSTNAIIQGSAAIQTKATLIELQKLCERKTTLGLGEWRLWAAVHDECILEVPDSITREDVQDFVDVMVNTYQFGEVPNKTDVELYKRWGNGISLDEWFNDK